MARMRECPKCHQEMEFMPAEPDVGIMSSTWFCHNCEHCEDHEEEDDYP